MSVAIAELFLRTIGCPTSRVLRQQLTIKTIDVPCLPAVNGALDTLAGAVIGVELRLVVAAPRGSDLVLCIVGAITGAGVSVIGETVSRIVVEWPLGTRSWLLTLFLINGLVSGPTTNPNRRSEQVGKE